METKIEIKNRWTGEILFELEEENNTVKDTLIEAVKSSADLQGAKLQGADLRYADLQGADLQGADLQGANLRYADLQGAKLQGADLQGAKLRYADLQGADLQGADLRYADLQGADLYGADLYGADLRSAKLRYADLQGADLQGADLQGAKLRGAKLQGAKLQNAKNVPYIRLSCPSDGAFVGWKKIKGYLVKLEVPEDARRSSATTSKCRCDKAKVLGITSIADGSTIDSIVNDSYHRCEYVVGEMVFPDSYDEDRWNECSHGIHFFINKQEAIEY